VLFAYADILMKSPARWPLKCLWFMIAMLYKSATTVYISGNSGHPCLVPELTVK
jgi:hypothetical protein